MITTLKLWVGTIKSTFTNVVALAVFAVLYAFLLVALYVFISTREATVWQVLLTYLLMVLIPAVFFILQSAIINRVRDLKFRWRAILIDALKFFVVALPILLIAWLIHYLLNKWQVRYLPPTVTSLPISPGPPKAQPTHWPSLIFATLRFVILGVAVPLATIHLWIALAGGEVRSLFAGGAKPFLKRMGAALARAFASDSILIYGLGLVFFFVLPYVVLFVPYSPRGTKTDFALFILRLLLTFVFSLVGWVVTLNALTRNYLVATPVVPPDPVPVPMEMAA